MRPKFSKKYQGINCRVYLVCEGVKRKPVTLNNSDDVYKLVKDDLSHSDREKLLSILLTAKNTLIGVETIGIGTLSSTVTTPREVFKSAILANADSIILCHNHPSGCLDPSGEDKRLTEALSKAGEVVGITVKDHLIVTSEGYRSLMNQ
jgi:DNA repair protein RadC